MENDAKTGFFKHVFGLEGDAKSELLNICQYAILAIIPVIGLNKTLRHFTPEIDDRKSSIEIVLEVLIQVVVIFMALLLIHRLITYVPTYSGLEYPEMNIIQIILIALLFLFSLNTSIAEKANIIIMRIGDYWEGRKSGSKKKKQGGGGAGGGAGAGGGSQGAMAAPAMPAAQATQQQQLPDYNDFYSKDTTPLVGAASPGMNGGGNEGFSPMMPGGLGPTLAQGGGGFGEPMAANAVLGGGSFGSAW